MTRSKLGLKALGLCAMLVGMFAFTGAAQAEVGAFWLVKGAKISESLLPTVLGETDKVGTLLTTLGGQLIDLTCQKFELIGAHLVEPLGKILGKILFHECDFLSLKKAGEPAVLQKACTPFVGANSGLIETENITGLIKLHTPTGGKAEGVLEAVATTAGGLFAKINLGPECAFGEFLKVGGPNASKQESVFFLKDCLGQFSTNVVKHLVEELKALTRLSINGGATTATIDGSAWAFLGGVAHEGLTWSGVPA